MEHECIIGLLHLSDEDCLVYLSTLKQHIESETSFIEYAKENGYSPFFWKDREVFAMKDYTDFRKNTDLTRFKFCPECGKKIDWKAIRSADHA